MQRLASRLDRLADLCARGAEALLLALLLIELVVMLLRHVFGLGLVALQESATYAFGGVVLLALGRTLRDDGHVRVDVLLEKTAPRRRFRVDIIGAVLLLMPFALVWLWFALPYAARSWAILEHSREASGLPLVFVLKSLLPLSAALLALAGLARTLRAIAGLGRSDRA